MELTTKITALYLILHLPAVPFSFSYIFLSLYFKSYQMETMGNKTCAVSFCCRWRRFSPCLCPTCVIPRTVATRTSAQGRSTDTPFRCFAMGSIAFGAWQQWLWTTPWNLSSLNHPYSNTVMMSKAFVMTALTLNSLWTCVKRLTVCFSTQLCVFKKLWLQT